MAERVGFEPTAHCCVTGFQDQLLKPLGHLSEYRPQKPRFILAYPFLFVNLFSNISPTPSQILDFPRLFRYLIIKFPMNLRDIDVF